MSNSSNSIDKALNITSNVIEVESEVTSIELTEPKVNDVKKIMNILGQIYTH